MDIRTCRGNASRCPRCGRGLCEKVGLNWRGGVEKCVCGGGGVFGKRRCHCPGRRSHGNLSTGELRANKEGDSSRYPHFNVERVTHQCSPL